MSGFTDNGPALKATDSESHEVGAHPVGAVKPVGGAVASTRAVGAGVLTHSLRVEQGHVISGGVQLHAESCLVGGEEFKTNT